MIKIAIVFTFATTGTLWRVHTVIVVDAIDLVVHINCEWNAVEALVADTTAEASRMIRFSHRLKNLKLFRLNSMAFTDNLLLVQLTISMIK